MITTNLMPHDSHTEESASMAPSSGPPRVPRTRTRSAAGRSAEIDDQARTRNVANPERVGSVAIGAALITYGLRRRDPLGVAAALIGGAFVHRGATGHCHVYDALGVSTGSADAVLGAGRSDVTSRAATVNARKAVKVEHSVMIGRPRNELYAFWHNFENLPRFMDHLVAVRVESPSRSHWKAKAPAGQTVEWDAELVNDVPDTIIAWKSVGDTTVPNAGAVNFSDAPGGRGTIVKVSLDYEPPAGKLGAAVARLFAEEPDNQVRDDLRRFKQLMETGEISRTP
jgi:uncharacterized membrane protein